MREIKFRLFGKNSKEFLRPERPGLSLKELQNVCDIDVWHVTQFTGVTDKNGVEIYEGDIIGRENGDVNLRYVSHHKIVWHDSGFMGKQICSNGSFIGINYWSRGDNGYVVIGNIYQNPELLGVTNGKD